MKKGIYLIFITVVFSGLANFFNKFGLEALGKDAYQYTALKNLAAATILSLFVFMPFIWGRLTSIAKQDWLRLILIALIGGSIPFLFFFKGLSMTSAVNASFIHKTLFIWVAILAWPILKEKITYLQLTALGVLLVGNFIFSGFYQLSFGVAELLILLATILWAVENIISKIVLKNLDSLTVAWARMFIGSLFLLVFLLTTGGINGLFSISTSQMGWLALVSVLLTGYVITWYGALKRLPVTVVASVLVLASPITTLLNSVFITHQLDGNKIIGGALIIVGVVMIWNFRKIENYGIKPVTT